MHVAGNHPHIIAGCRNFCTLKYFTKYAFWQCIAEHYISKPYIGCIINVCFSNTDVSASAHSCPVILWSYFYRIFNKSTRTIANYTIQKQRW